jgi:hypothetical protein
MITLEKVAAIVAEQRRDAAYQVVLQAQRELKRYEHEYVAALKALEQLTINEGA